MINKQLSEACRHLTNEQNALLNVYCANNLRKLKDIVLILVKKYNISQSEYDDVISDAMYTLLESVISFDKNQAVKFKTYLISNLRRSISDWYRDNYLRAIRSPLLLDNKGKIVYVEDENGGKKPLHVKMLSLDYPTEDNVDFKDLIPGKMDIKEDDFEYSSQMKEYLSRLSKIQRKILEYLIEGYLQEEIQEILHISSSSYRDNFRNIMDEKNLKIIRVLIDRR